MKIFIHIMLLAIGSYETKDSLVSRNESTANTDDFLELLKSKTAQKALEAKGALLYNLGNEELAHEDFDGKQILAINERLTQLDKDLIPLSKMSFKKGELKLMNAKYQFSTTKQFFRHYDKPDCIYLQLIDDFLRKNDIEKKVFLIYDYDEAEFALCIVKIALFEEVLYSMSKLKTMNERNNPKRLNYLLKQNPRVIELTGIVNNSPYRSDVIIRKEN